MMKDVGGAVAIYLAQTPAWLQHEIRAFQYKARECCPKVTAILSNLEHLVQQTL